MRYHVVYLVAVVNIQKSYYLIVRELQVEFTGLRSHHCARALGDQLS
jgi:hypothetical protein